VFGRAAVSMMVRLQVEIDGWRRTTESYGNRDWDELVDERRFQGKTDEQIQLAMRDDRKQPIREIAGVY
jgi:hypothetical protein